MATPQMRRRTRSIALLTAGLLALIAMAPVVANQFTTWDDLDTIARNWRITPPSIEGLAAHWREPHMSLYVPVTYTVWSLVSALSHAATGALSPAFFHAASLILHALAAVAVCGWIMTLLAGREQAAQDGPSQSGAKKGGKAASQRSMPVTAAIAAAAVGGAALFAIHPMQVESVAWASGLKDVLMGLLSVLCLWAAAAANVHWHDAKRRGRLLATAGVLLVAALLAKPTAMVVPVMAVPMLRLIGVPWRRVGLIAGVGLLLALPFAVVAKLVQPAHLVIDAGPIWARPLIAGDAYAFYVRKVVWPVSLAPDYGRTPSAVMAAGTHWWAWAIPAALAAGLWLGRWRWPVVAAGLLIAAIPILPVSGLVPFEFQDYSTVSDHYFYLPLAGLGLALAGVILHLRGRGGPGRAVAVVAAIVGLVLIVHDWRQMGRWCDTQTIFQHTAAVNPRSYSAYTTLASVALDERRLDDAEALAQKALEARPDYVNALVTLGSVRQLRGEAAGAEEAFRDALEVAPNDAVALANYGALLAEQRRADEAMSALRRAVEVDPDLAPARLNLGTLLAMTGRMSEAEQHLRVAVRLSPRDPRALTNLAIVLKDLGRSGEARDLLLRALEIDPDFAPARNVLGAG